MSAELGVYFLAVDIHEDDFRFLVGHVTINTVPTDLASQPGVDAASLHLMTGQATLREGHQIALALVDVVTG